MGTYSHLLTRQAPGGLPGRIISIDTHPTVTPDLASGWRARHTLRAGAVVVTDYVRGQVARREEYTFNSQAECWRLIESRLYTRRTTWVVGHNLAYDLTLSGFWQWLEANHVRLEGYVIDDPPTCLHLTHGRHRIRIVDVLNYWRKPLGSMAAALGLDCPAGRPGEESDRGAADMALAHARVVAVAFDCLVSFLARHLGGGWRQTAAGIAWAAYRSRVWGDRLRVHANKEATALERAAYHGGRLVCHRRGRVIGPVYALDANNLYGSVMHGQSYPIRLRMVGYQAPPALLRLLQDGWPAVATVTAHTDDDSLPLRVGRSVVWAPGSRTITLAGPDLVPLLAEGRITAVHSASVYHPGRPFDSYVEHWYGARLLAREAGDTAGAALAKLVTCQLFGRIGMKGRRWVPYTGGPPPARYCTWHERSPDGEGWVRHRAVAGVAQRYEEAGESAHSAVAVACYVTAYGRRRLLHWRSIAGPAEVYYEDTDCLHTSRLGYERLLAAGEVDGARLGALKVEACWPAVVYHGVKDYSTPNARVCAGLSAGAAEVADGVYLQERRQGLTRLPSEGPPDAVVVDQTPFTVPGAAPS